MLTMRDSITPSTIPIDGTDIVAGYGDGRYQWSPIGWSRFQNIPKLSIVVHPTHDGDVLDIENGDAAPASAPGWCDRFNRPLRRAPSLYCNRATWPAVKAAVGSRKVDYWIATLDGETKFVPGAVAVQWKNFGGYDESIVVDPAWVGLDVNYAQLYDLIVKSWYMIAFKRNPQQSEVDYWVNKLVGGENGEQVLDEFFASPEGQTFLHVAPSSQYNDAQAIKAIATKLNS